MEGKSTVSDTVRVPLTQGKVAIIDAEDSERVLRHKWRLLRAPRTCYAQTTRLCADGIWRTLFLHRFIIDAPDGSEVDHWDNDGLNNRRGNLVVCTRSIHAERQRVRRNNKIGYLGVSKQTLNRSWAANICHRGQRIYLGTFAVPEDAARAYDAKARELRGDRATVNFPDEGRHIRETNSECVTP